MNETTFEDYSVTDEFKDWMRQLDHNVKASINLKLKEYKKNGCLPTTAGLSKGHGGIGEMRFHFGPGYRIYYCRYGKILLLLLCGGIKDTQTADFVEAEKIKAREIKTLKL